MRRPLALWWMIGRGAARIIGSVVVLVMGSVRDWVRGSGDPNRP